MLPLVGCGLGAVSKGLSDLVCSDPGMLWYSTTGKPFHELPRKLSLRSGYVLAALR